MFCPFFSSLYLFFAQTYSPVFLLNFCDFWYVGPLGGVLITFFWIFRNFDFWGLEGRKGSILVPNSLTSPGDRNFWPIFVIFGMWHPWPNISGIAFQFFQLGGQGGQKGSSSLIG